MASVLDILRGISMYPVPAMTIEGIATRRGVYLDEAATQEVLTSASFRLAKADLLMWLSTAPNISQGGQSYSFTDEQQRQFRNEANSLYDKLAEDDLSIKPIYGYKGNRL